MMIASLLNSPFLAAVGLLTVTFIIILFITIILVLLITSIPTVQKSLMFMDISNLLLSVPFTVARVFVALTQILEQIPSRLGLPFLRSWRLLDAMSRAQVLIALVELEIPELLERGGQTAQQLADSIPTGPVKIDLLTRLLDAAVAFDLIDATNRKAGKTRVYRISGASAALCPSHPNCIKSVVMLNRYQRSAWFSLAEGVRTGETPWRIQHGCTFWDSVSKEPEELRWFNDAMVALSKVNSSVGVLADYPCGRYTRMVDVGGGMGSFLEAALRKHPHMKGALMDLDGVIHDAKEAWSKQHADLLPRVTFHGGDFFSKEDIPPAASSTEVYVLRAIIHDWADPECLKILKSVRHAIGDTGAKLALIEAALVDEMGETLHIRRMSDMTMMVMCGSKERSEDEFRELLRQAGFRLTGIVATRGVMFVVEAEAAA